MTHSSGRGTHRRGHHSGLWQTRHSPRQAAEDADATYGRGLELVMTLAIRWLASLSPNGTRVMVCLPLVMPTD
jgi:hypothetical protein